MQITEDELRTLILRLCEAVSKNTGSDPDKMIADIERIAELNLALKDMRNGRTVAR